MVSTTWTVDLSTVGFTSIPDSDGTTVKRTELGVSLYVSRSDTDQPHVPSRLAFKDVEASPEDPAFYKGMPSGYDMTKKLWQQLVSGFSNASILFFLTED